MNALEFEMRIEYGKPLMNVFTFRFFFNQISLHILTQTHTYIHHTNTMVKSHTQSTHETQVAHSYESLSV